MDFQPNADFEEKYIFSNNGFYPLSMKDIYINAGSWPESGVEVGSDVFDEFTGTPPKGKYRGHDEYGAPVWIDIPPPTLEERIAAIESLRQRLMSEVDSVTSDWRTELALGDISDTDREQLSAWMAYKRQVKAVSPLDAIVDGFTWPSSPGQGHL